MTTKRILIYRPSYIYGLVTENLEKGNGDLQRGMGIMIELLKALGRASKDLEEKEAPKGACTIL